MARRIYTLISACVQETTNYVDLPCTGRPPLDAPVERHMKADYLLRRQEPGEPGSRVHPCASGGVHGDQAAGDPRGS